MAMVMSDCVIRPLKDSKEGQRNGRCQKDTESNHGVVGAVRKDREARYRGPEEPTVWERVVQARQ